MISKARTVPGSLKILRILNMRMDLKGEDYKNYLNAEKGYQGEVQFDNLIDKLHMDCLILNDLLLEVNNTKFQIDSIMIFQHVIGIYEVKNFEGDFRYDHDEFHTAAGKEIKNPLDQLKRSNFLLRQLLQNLGFNIPIEASVIFINPEFHLYHAPEELAFIFPTQLNRFLKKLKTKPVRLTKMHEKLAQKLIALHQIESPYERLPMYKFEDLKKGITCLKCHSFSLTILGKRVVCGGCGYTEEVSEAVMRSVGEFKLLFPHRKITTNDIHEWCKIIDSKKRITRILKRRLKTLGVRQWTYFE